MASPRKRKKTKEEKEPSFAAWPLGVKGKLTREEIYEDYLKRKVNRQGEKNGED